MKAKKQKTEKIRKKEIKEENADEEVEIIEQNGEIKPDPDQRPVATKHRREPQQVCLHKIFQGQ